MCQPMPAVTADGTFDDTWPFRARYTDAPGLDMRYVDEGTEPEIVRLLHGEPTWGYLFRQQIPGWAARHQRPANWRAAGPRQSLFGPVRAL